MRVNQKNHDEFVAEIFNLVGNEYTVLGEYISCQIKVKMVHNICECIFSVIPNNFLSKNSRCPRCAKNERISTEDFKKKLYDIVNTEYSVVGEYYNAKTKIEIIHNKCGRKYFVTPTNLLTGKRCPSCKKSKGEVRIENYLKLNSIKYGKQYKFRDCINIRPLPFDFAIFDYYGQLSFLIEYDGQQHYHSIPSMGGDERFLITQRNDNLKNIFCSSGDIELLRISYTEYELIEDIISKKLQESKLIPL